MPANATPKNVRRFGTFTADLGALADWFKECGITSVAMEATGVYWIPVFQLLEERVLAVILVNARQTKNVAGRKSDVQDCQWIQRLHMQKALEGDYREEQLFVLQQAFSLYGTYEEKLNACDEQIVRETATLPDKVDPLHQPLPPRKEGRPAKLHALKKTAISMGFNLIAKQEVASPVS